MINDFAFFNLNNNENPVAKAQKYIAKAQEYLLNNDPCLALTSLNNADEVLTRNSIDKKEYSEIMEQISEEAHIMMRVRGYDY